MLRSPHQLLQRVHQRTSTYVARGAPVRTQRMQMATAPPTKKSSAGTVVGVLLVGGTAYLGLAYASTTLPADVQKDHPVIGALQFGRDIIAKVTGKH